MKWYVYVIESDVDGRLYKGMTENIENRIKQHNNGRTFSTKSYTPWKLVYFEECDSRQNARAREIFLKSGAGREFIKKELSKKLL